MTLWIDSGEQFALRKTRFFHESSGESIYAQRGRNPLGIVTQNSFPWSPAVQALTILLLRTAAKQTTQSITSQHSDTGQGVCIEGEAGSPASSLDYAIGKQNSWLLSIFGINEHNEPFIKEIFRRINPERKRSGPVSVSVNRHILKAQSIQILLNETPVTEPLELEAIASQIETLWKPQRAKSLHLSSPPGKAPPQINCLCGEKPKGEIASAEIQPQPVEITLPRPFHELKWKQILHQQFENEIQSMLRVTDIFHRREQEILISEVLQNPNFTELAGKNRQLVSEIDNMLSASNRLGVSAHEAGLINTLSCDRPLHIAISPSQTASIAIFTYLKWFRKLNIELNFRHALSSDIFHAIRDNGFRNYGDMCVLTMATAARFLALGKSSSFLPLMLMPKISHRILTPKNGRSANPRQNTLQRGRYLILSEEPCCQYLYFDDLRRSKAIDPNQSTVDYLFPHEITAALSTGEHDLRAVLGFPHYSFNELFTNSCALDQKYQHLANRGSILFLSNERMKNDRFAQGLDIVVRDAWLSLRENDELLRQVVKKMLEVPDYVKFLTRTFGLFQLRTEETVLDEDFPLCSGGANLNSEQTYQFA